MKEISVTYTTGQNETKRETVAYITPEDACKVWLLHPATSRIIVQKYTEHTHPYLSDLNAKIDTMKDNMKHHDYMFTGHHTGLEWYACLERVYDDYLRENLVQEQDGEVSSNLCLTMSFLIFN